MEQRTGSKIDFSRIFATLPKEQLQHFVKQYESDAAVRAQATSAPAELQENLNNCNTDFLHGYMLGILHSSNTIALIHDCLAAGDKASAAVAELRSKVFAYLACRKLAELSGCEVASLEPSRIIKPDGSL